MQNVAKCIPWLTALLVLGLAVDCGGTTSTLGGDASADGAGGSSGGGSGGSSGGSSGGGTSSSGSGSSSGGNMGMNCPTCEGFICCNGVSCNVDPYNDPTNCGGCGNTCSGSTPFCMNGKCTQTPCTQGQDCAPDTSCCGGSCCASGQICCEMEGPVSGEPTCYTPTQQQPTCPLGCLTCVSDRNVKRDIVPVDQQAVLEGVARVPVATWSYKADDPAIRHMGPMAQDFYGEFGLGDTDKAYNAIDAHGVAFAAIQALYERMKDQDARIDRLERENAVLRGRRESPPSTPAKPRRPGRAIDVVRSGDLGQ
jgi:hypothetical protein